MLKHPFGINRPILFTPFEAIQEIFLVEHHVHRKKFALRILPKQDFTRFIVLEIHGHVRTTGLVHADVLLFFVLGVVDAFAIPENPHGLEFLEVEFGM